MHFKHNFKRNPLTISDGKYNMMKVFRKRDDIIYKDSCSVEIFFQYNFFYYIILLTGMVAKKIEILCLHNGIIYLPTRMMKNNHKIEIFTKFSCYHYYMLCYSIMIGVPFLHT